MASNHIAAAITRKFLGERPIKALLDSYNSKDSTKPDRFNTSRADRCEANGPSPKNQANWVILDSDWAVPFFGRSVSSELSNLSDSMEVTIIFENPNGIFVYERIKYLHRVHPHLVGKSQFITT